MVINYVALITHYYDIIIHRHCYYGYCQNSKPPVLINHLLSFINN